MAHDSATARQHYYRPKMALAAVETNDRMRKVLQVDKTPPTIDPLAAAAANSAPSATPPLPPPYLGQEVGVDMLAQ